MVTCSCCDTVTSLPLRMYPVAWRVAMYVPHLHLLLFQAELASVAATILGAGHQALPGKVQCATLPVEQRLARSSPCSTSLVATGNDRGGCLRRCALPVSMLRLLAPILVSCSQLQALQPALLMGDQVWMAVLPS